MFSLTYFLFGFATANSLARLSSDGNATTDMQSSMDSRSPAQARPATSLAQSEDTKQMAVRTYFGFGGVQSDNELVYDRERSIENDPFKNFKERMEHLKPLMKKDDKIFDIQNDKLKFSDIVKSDSVYQAVKTQQRNTLLFAFFTVAAYVLMICGLGRYRGWLAPDSEVIVGDPLLWIIGMVALVIFAIILVFMGSFNWDQKLEILLSIAVLSAIPHIPQLIELVTFYR
jgi:hypothetical protein